MQVGHLFLCSFAGNISPNTKEELNKIQTKLSNNDFMLMPCVWDRNTWIGVENPHSDLEYIPKLHTSLVEALENHQSCYLDRSHRHEYFNV